MFRGVATFNLDAKGRMAIPAKFRKHLDVCCEGRLVVTIDHSDHCLQLYPLPEWEQVEEKLAALPSLNPQVRKLKRMLLGYATECEMDSNGRILLPAKLREFAVLEKSVVMIGQGNKFELWNEQTWNALMDECLEEDFGEILPAELESLSI
ncbi:MAG TPA: transcriptional regulator MraZ [Methylophaga aminisulfidivorans]|uniref:Transcriptional regulator MraZ n=1 Tax=Methylophaga aminisulfidivorans TaxID=230105 RepID=A0A7C1ZSC0_9GAMM|nr:transcriptional regulator MraZ [Methylophaga aminisulfidivorans]